MRRSPAGTKELLLVMWENHRSVVGMGLWGLCWHSSRLPVLRGGVGVGLCVCVYACVCVCLYENTGT